MTTATRKTRTPKKSPEPIVTIQAEVVTEVLPVIEPVDPVEIPMLMLESPQPVKNKRFILRLLPNNTGTTSKVEEAWSGAITELGRLIKGTGLEYSVANRSVNGVETQYILAEEKLLNYLIKRHPEYLGGKYPEYHTPQSQEKN